MNDVTTILDVGDASVSVAIEDVASRDWDATVYQPEILPHWDTLYMKTGYGPRPVEKR